MPPLKRPRPKAPLTRGPARKVRILVADDQAIDRRGLVSLLETQLDFEVVAEVATGKDASNSFKRSRPDVVIMSTRLPDLGGESSIAFLRAEHPSAHVIALAERGAQHCLVLNPPRRSHPGLPMIPDADMGMCTDCLQLAVSEGALGALRRDAEPEQLFRAVREVAQGNAWYEARTASRMASQAREAGNAARDLSSRELEVAGLIADGRSNKEIGQALGISEPTVKKHVGHVLVKLGLQDRLQIGIYIVRNPLLFDRRRGER